MEVDETDRTQRVADVRVGKIDFACDPIECLYTYNPPHYAIYRTAKRVMVHFSDNPQEAAEQRRRIAPLAPLRGQISGLIDGWHSARAGFLRLAAAGEQDVKRREETQQKAKHYLRKRADRYDRRVADAIALALEGSGDTAMALLAEIKNDIISERTSIARIGYFFAALALATVIWLVVIWFTGLVEEPRLIPVLGLAVIGGTLGAMYSIVIGIRGRTILINLQDRTNWFDAALRVTVGAVSGAMIICLLLSGFVENLVHMDRIRPQSYQPLSVFMIGFLGGFFERLVPDLLTQTSLGTTERRTLASGTAATIGSLPASPPPPPPSPPPPSSGIRAQTAGDAGAGSGNAG